MFADGIDLLDGHTVFEQQPGCLLHLDKGNGLERFFNEGGGAAGKQINEKIVPL